VRLQNPNTDLKVGWCLEPHDLAASKLAAGREKDWTFVEQMIRHGIARADVLRARIETLPIPEERRQTLARWVAARA
jgi:hypothetical protein